jgi:hypothetical protein
MFSLFSHFRLFSVVGEQQQWAESICTGVSANEICDKTTVPVADRPHAALSVSGLGERGNNEAQDALRRKT